MISPRSSRLAPLLASLALGAILAGAGLALAVDAPRLALLDGTRDASVAPTVNVPPTVDLAPTVDIPPTVGVPPIVDVVPQPLPAAAAPGATDGATPRAEPGTLALPPTPPKTAQTDAGRRGARPADARAPARSARQAPRDTIAAVVAATNAERVAAGCRALRVDDRINTAAQRHSVDMANRRNMSHIGGDGSRFTDRLRAAGYPRPGAENIAFGQRTAARVVADWMASSGHRRNILNCAYTTIGVGFDPRGHYWTQNFGF
ncbi:MAG TPA: CAP domain-containing protein [Pseudonocardiaceae bacterium]|nr:CAP domain-containing protein [Pseudonocardiaceae bacterium]